MDLLNRLTPQTTLLTPNRRLAARISKIHAEENNRSSFYCWTTLDILPLYPSWLERLWKNYSAYDLQCLKFLLSTQQEQILWEKIIRELPENESLLQLTSTAKLAKSAWETLKRWQVKLTDPALGLTEDSRAFIKWANKFQTLCSEQNWLDQNSLVDVIIQKIQEKKIPPPPHLILVGFTEIAPQYQNLLKCCEKFGSKVEHYQNPSQNESVFQIGMDNNESEIEAMARWAKSLSSVSSSIGCIIPNLEVQREKVIQIFTEVVGQNQFNISAGKSLTAYPIIYDALHFLTLNNKSVSLEKLRHALHSPFLGEAESERYKRALFDIRLQSLNIQNFSVSSLLDPSIKHNLNAACPQLAKRFTAFFENVNELTYTLPISQWVVIFNDLLSALGWPGQRSLNSHEYQVVQNAWLSLLNSYKAFDKILGPQTYTKALHYLNCLAMNAVFQPESPETAIQVLGILEAADTPFDHAWVMGLDDSTWPAKPKPNPFIPLRLQKNLHMPNASPERELLYCQRLTTQLHNSAKNLILSYPKQSDDAELRPSALLAKYPEIHLNDLNLSPFISSSKKVYEKQDLEIWHDEHAPPILPEEKIEGGTRIFKNQADCPFKAFSELRLHAKKIDETSLGLDKINKGIILHKAMELIWLALRDSNTLNLKNDSELEALINQCAEQALMSSVSAYLRPNTRYLTIELQRLKKIIWDWLQFEKTRPAFRVVALEHTTTFTFGNIQINFRVDRIDELTSENTNAKQFIIDYKTAKDLNKSSWFGERLDEPQLPIYCLAHRHETLGIAFAKINAHQIDVMGIANVSININGVETLDNVKQADATLWQEQLLSWDKNLTQLAYSFSQGDAKVDPKNGALTCKNCGLHAFCRIHELRENYNECTDEEFV